MKWVPPLTTAVIGSLRRALQTCPVDDDSPWAESRRLAGGVPAAVVAADAMGRMHPTDGTVVRDGFVAVIANNQTKKRN